MDRRKTNRPRDKTARAKPPGGFEPELTAYGSEIPSEMAGGADNSGRSDLLRQRTFRSRSVLQRDDPRVDENIRDKAVKKRRQSLSRNMVKAGQEQENPPAEEHTEDYTFSGSAVTQADTFPAVSQTDSGDKLFTASVEAEAPAIQEILEILHKTERTPEPASDTKDTAPRFIQPADAVTPRTDRPFKPDSNRLIRSDPDFTLRFEHSAADNLERNTEAAARKQRGSAYVNRFTESAVNRQKGPSNGGFSHSSDGKLERTPDIPLSPLSPVPPDQSGQPPPLQSEAYTQIRLDTEEPPETEQQADLPERADIRPERAGAYSHERSAAPITEKPSGLLRESAGKLLFDGNSKAASTSSAASKRTSAYQAKSKFKPGSTAADKNDARDSGATTKTADVIASQDYQTADSFERQAVEPEQISAAIPISGHESATLDIHSQKRDKPPPSDNPRSKAKKLTKLQFTEDAPKTPKQAAADKQAVPAQSEADRSQSKLDKAVDNLPKKRGVDIGKAADSKTGAVTKGLRFDGEVKNQSEYLKGAPITRPVKHAANAMVFQARREMYQEEHENVGVQAAHQTEKLVESGLRTAYRQHKSAAYRKASKLEGKTAKLNVKAAYRKSVADNPKLQSSALSRIAQKRKFKKQYAKSVRDTRKTAALVKKSGSVAGKAVRIVIRSVSRHPAVFGTIAAFGFLLIIIMSALSSCSNIAGGIGSAVAAASYLAEDADVDGAELFYTELETDLKEQISGVEADYPGYDEYRRNIGDISHNPYELMAYLTARYQDFTLSEVEPELLSLFNEQYQLTFRSTTETRYDEDGEPYEWRVMTVTLAAHSFYDVAYSRLSDGQRQIYALLMQTRGSRQYAYNPFDFGWLGYVTDGYGWRISPITGERQYHKGVDIGVPTGTPILAAHAGTVTTGYDAGGYGYYISLDDCAGLVTKYAHCSELIAADGAAVQKGDIIAESGNSGSSTGPHLHFEVIKDGAYINPLYFAAAGDSGAGPVYGTPGLPMGDGSYAALIAEAEQFLGMPYVWGGSSPSTSFDCSGFVCWVLNQSGTAGVGRTTAQGLYNLCKPIPDDEARPGDLLFLTGTYSTVNPVTHVAIYVGNNMVIHAGDPIQYSRIDTSWWRSHHYSFGRIN